nr:reverse transcriptase [Tanacetum cinerariifolium]
MSPFRALYGRELPSLPQYTLGSSQVASIDATLVEHQRVITLLKNTFAKTGQRMTDKANKHRIDKDFQEGDLIYLRLRIYRQSSVAYHLELPPGSRIHPIFHVSLLRPSIGNSNPSTLPLPEKFIDNLPVLTPEEVLDHRTINNQGQAEQQVDGLQSEGPIGTVAREHFGLALLFSMLIVRIAAALSSFSYVELASHCLSARSAHHYSYIYVGEGLASATIPDGNGWRRFVAIILFRFEQTHPVSILRYVPPDEVLLPLLQATIYSISLRIISRIQI